MAVSRRCAAGFTCAVALASGCGKSENDWPVTVRPEYSYADLAKDLPADVCERFLRCPTPKDDSLVPRLLFGTIARCIEVLTPALRRPARTFDVSAAIKKGTVVFHADAAKAYVDALAGPCDSSGAELDPTAGGALTGTVDAGGDCAVTLECAAGNYCEHANGACPGTCAKLKASGAACTIGPECESGYCNQGLCSKLTVAKDAAAGEPCGFQAGSYATKTPCGPNLFCQGSPTGTCRKAIPADAPCTSQDDVCAQGHLCLTDVDGMKRCRPVAVAQEGELCSDDAGPDVRYCDAFAFLTCEQATCKAAASGTEGAGCVRTEFSDSCDSGLYCASASHVCEKLGQVGDPCSSTEECASGYCISGTGSCSDVHCE